MFVLKGLNSTAVYCYRFVSREAAVSRPKRSAWMQKESFKRCILNSEKLEFTPERLGFEGPVGEPGAECCFCPVVLHIDDTFCLDQLGCW